MISDDVKFVTYMSEYWLFLAYFITKIELTGSSYTDWKTKRTCAKYLAKENDAQIYNTRPEMRVYVERSKKETVGFLCASRLARCHYIAVSITKRPFWALNVWVGVVQLLLCNIWRLCFTLSRTAAHCQASELPRACSDCANFLTVGTIRAKMLQAISMDDV